jgi:hypothetical protein
VWSTLSSVFLLFLSLTKPALSLSLSLSFLPTTSHDYSTLVVVFYPILTSTPTLEQPS